MIFAVCVAVMASSGRNARILVDTGADEHVCPAPTKGDTLYDAQRHMIDVHVHGRQGHPTPTEKIESRTERVTRASAHSQARRAWSKEHLLIQKIVTTVEVFELSGGQMTVGKRRQFAAAKQK